jgi:hypothetical protein
MLQNVCALEKPVTVQAGPQLKMTAEQGPGILKNFQDVFLFHWHSFQTRHRRCRAFRRE